MSCICHSQTTCPFSVLYFQGFRVLLLCNDLFTPSHLLRQAAAWRSPKEAAEKFSRGAANRGVSQDPLAPPSRTPLVPLQIGKVPQKMRPR
jgi:hypothetical protein